MTRRLIASVVLFVLVTGGALADDARHLFILSGQSNMHQPLPDSFRRCVEQVFGADRAVVVTVAHPSQPIKQWYKDWKPPEGMTDPKPEANGSLYGKLLAAVRKAVSGAKPDAGGAGLSALVDGRYGKADHTDKAWLGFAPTDGVVSLTIDLVEPTDIDAIAVNPLISTTAKAEFPDPLRYETSVDGRWFELKSARYNTIKFYNRKDLNRMRAEGINPRALLLLTRQNQTTARYIRVEIVTGDQWVYLDEVIVNPVKRAGGAD